MGVLAEVGWITLDDGSIEHRFAAGAISVIALLSGLIFYAYTYRKWGPFLSNLKLDLHNIQEEEDSLHGSTLAVERSGDGRGGGEEGEAPIGGGGCGGGGCGGGPQEVEFAGGRRNRTRHQWEGGQSLEKR